MSNKFFIITGILILIMALSPLYPIVIPVMWERLFNRKRG